MSITLQDYKNPSSTFDLTTPYWLNLLKKATELGWKPLGTIIDAKDPSIPVNQIMNMMKSWNGSYETNDGQVMIEKDSKALLNVLKQHKQEIEEDTNIKIIDNEFIEFLEKAQDIKIL